MLTIQNYIKAESLQQAYELNRKKSNRILGGMLWLKMQSGMVTNAIDLSGLSLDAIEETREQFSIGCMTTLRRLELHPGLDAYTQGAVRKALSPIVGVQFRNLATVGGSLFGRFGFSDVLTVFMAMDSYVELYQGGIIPLSRFASMPYDDDILVRLIIKKTPLSVSYFSHRNTATDLPVLTCAVSKPNGSWQAVIGARPHRAVLIPDVLGLLNGGITPEAALSFAAFVQTETKTGSNTRASARFRTHLAGVLTRRALDPFMRSDSALQGGLLI